MESCKLLFDDLRFLLKLDHQVLEISSSTPSNGKDIFSYQDLQNEKLNISPDLVIHLASLNSNLNKKDIEEEILITKNVLKIMRSTNCSKIIFFSSAKVYGDNSYEQKIYSECDELNPVCSYGSAKRECEQLIINFSQSSSLSYYIFRLPPLITSESDSNLNKLIKLGLSSYFLPTFSIGDLNKRSFISITNIKNVLSMILENLNAIEEKSEIFNISDNDFTSLNQLINFSNSTKLLRLPTSLFYILIKIPFFREQMLKLYGNFMIDNSKIKNKITVNLNSTTDSLPKIFK